MVRSLGKDNKIIQIEKSALLIIRSEFV